MAMVLWKRFCHFFIKKNFFFMPLLVKISWKYDFFDILYLLLSFCSKTKKIRDFLPSPKKYDVFIVFYNIFHKTKNMLLSCPAWRHFFYCSTVISLRKISFSVYNCLVKGYPQIYTSLVSIWVTILLAPPKSENRRIAPKIAENVKIKLLSRPLFA